MTISTRSPFIAAPGYQAAKATADLAHTFLLPQGHPPQISGSALAAAAGRRGLLAEGRRGRLAEGRRGRLAEGRRGRLARPLPPRATATCARTSGSCGARWPAARRSTWTGSPR